MKEKAILKSKEAEKSKDYYYTVIIVQLFLCIIISVIFFILKGSDDGTLMKSYCELLKDDFLSRGATQVVNAVKQYVYSNNQSYPVFSGTAVYGENMLPEEKSTDGNIQKEQTTFEQEASTTEKSVISSAVIETVGLRYENENPLDEVLTLEKKGRLLFPLNEGRYTSYFGSRDDPLDGGSDYHGGVDIGADYGDKIRAAHDGIITAVGEDSVSGKYVFLTYNQGFETFYCHCSEVLVKEGNVIRQGETIALVGSTGKSTGPHLHFEVRVNGNKVDPLSYLENAS